MEIDKVIENFAREEHLFKIFMTTVVNMFQHEPSLNQYGTPIIHTIKSRLKDKEHLKDKILRKHSAENPITEENFFERVTDLAGVRVLHLYQDQFINIHNFIEHQIQKKEWFYRELPVAYTWDPECREFFNKLGLETKVRESYYTSIHYLIKPKEDSLLTCEVQVRTLFEEIWGEIDHTINYPSPTENASCREQLRVLSKLVSTGTRLADSIFRTHKQN
ncbi:RelA/SpoT domain-containing protein [Pantoea ananatis]|uniref:RelA/SpoT domain-containing protein n=1 Tax=Pantoea ananas TaxID=553 RepID=UPI000E267944|nr:RelA/SpoT domain-containing protein [Pantoea ananatis]REC88962.1 RelA/SpoT family protein [Pantoea ananatis]